MPRHYYIDGYNVVYQCPDLKAVALDDLERARDALVEQVVRHCGATGHRASIVFDGRGLGNLHRQSVQAVGPGVELIFSPARHSADAVIEREVYRSQNRRGLVVVSADRGIRALCHGLGSLVMAPKNFMETLRESVAHSRTFLSESTNAYTSSAMEDRLNEPSRSRLQRLRAELGQKKKPAKDGGSS